MKSTANFSTVLLLLILLAMPTMARNAENQKFLNALFNGDSYPVALTQSPTYPWIPYTPNNIKEVRTSCNDGDGFSNNWFSLDMYVPEDSASIVFDYTVKPATGLTCTVDGEEVFRFHGAYYIDNHGTPTIKVGQGYHTVKWNLQIGLNPPRWDYFGLIKNMRIEGISDEVPLPEYSKCESRQWSFPSENVTDIITIENIGKEPLRISGIEGISSPFHIISPVNTVAPGASEELVISFEPQEDGCFEQTLTLTTNAGIRKIPLYGICYDTTPVCVSAPGKLSEVVKNTDLEALTIFGPTNHADQMYLNKFKKLKYLDLRGTDMEYIFNGGINNLYTLEDILLPSSLRCIDATWYWKHYVGRYDPDDYYAIKTITCLSPEPPKRIYIGEMITEGHSFDGLRDDVVVYVPAAYIPYYSSDPGWNKFRLSAISDDSRSIKATIGRACLKDYEGCTLALEDLATGRSQRLTIGNVAEYVFHNIKPDRYYDLKLLHPSKRVLANKDSITVGGDRSVVVSLDTIIPLYTATLRVFDNEEVDISGSVKSVWSVPDGKTVMGDRVSGLLEGDSISCHVALPKELGYKYDTPDPVSHIVTDGENILKVTLRPLERNNVHGRILGSDMKPLPSATLSVSQSLGDNLTWDKVCKPDENGVFDLSVYQGVVRFAITCDRYFTSVRTDTIIDDVDFGDMILSQCEGRKVKLEVNFQDNAPKGSDGYITGGYDDWKNLALSVHDGDNADGVVDIKNEYPYVYLDGAVKENANLTVLLSHRNHKFKDMEIPCVDSGDGNFTAQATIVEYGDIKVVKLGDNDMATKAILYDVGNNQVRTCKFVNGIASFKCVPDGVYQIVGIEDNGMYGNISDYAQFATLGLSEGKDFAYASVEVSSGVVEEIVFSDIPEISTGTKIAGSRTTLSPAKSSVTAGNYLTVKSLIEIKPEYVGKIENLTLNVLIPDSTEFVPNSLLIGSQLATFSIEGRSVEIPIFENSDEIRFCVLPKKGGGMNINAYLSYEIDGMSFKESIGGFAVDVTGVTLNVMPTVPRPDIKVSGTGPAGYEVEIIEDNIVLGRAMILANGGWKTAVTLCDDRDLRTHNIHARLTSSDGQVLYSENRSVRVDSMRPYVRKVEMINASPRQYVTTFDFSNPFDTKPSYSYNSSYPDFTFRVWFDNVTDPLSINDAVLWVRTSNGKDIPIHLVASLSDTSLMVGTYAFRSSYSLPTNVAVELNYVDESVLQPQNAIDILSDAMPTADAIDILHSENNEAVSFELASSQSSFSLLCGSVNYSRGDAMSVKIDEAVSRFRFEPVLEDEDFLLSPEKGLLWKEKIDASHTRASFMYDITSRDEFESVMSFLDKNLVRKPQSRVQLDSNNRLVPNRASFALSHRVDQSLQELIDICNKKLDCVEKAGEIDVAYAAEDMRKTLNNMTGLNLAMAATLISGTHEIVMNAPRGESVVENALNSRDLVEESANTVIAVEGISESMRTHIRNLNRYPTECGLSSAPQYVGSGVSPLIDPSGYVYEAVASNRLEGVKATAYHKTSSNDENGNTVEDISIWDASMYEQENPLFTDSEGRYAWDVPAGLWQVKYEKAGYEPAESEWLPVPPPQMDVNIGMRQLVNPTVDYARAYPDSVVCAFTKYMDVNSLDDKNFSVEKNGILLDGRLEIPDAESCDGRQYASRVMFIPDNPLAAGDTVDLSISSKTRSYAGCPLADDYKEALTVETPMELDIPGLVEMEMGETVRVMIQSNLSGLSGKRLHVKIDGDAFVSTLQQEPVFDGKEACVELTGLLPGKAIVTVSPDGYGVTATTTVTVHNNLMKQVRAPWATIESGATVNKGTLLYLFSATPDTKIYYTTDGSCPCDIQSRLLYDAEEGIRIDHDVTIKAYAESENMSDSEVTELTYTVDLNGGTVPAIIGHGVRITPVYLTPGNENVRVLFEGGSPASFDIFDIHGIKIAGGRVYSGDEISFAKYMKGLYIISVNIDNLRLSEKIVKSF